MDRRPLENRAIGAMRNVVQFLTTVPVYPADMPDPSDSLPPNDCSPTPPLQSYLDKTYELGRTRIRVGYRGQGNSAWPLHSGAVRRLLDKLAVDSPEDDSAFAAHFLDYHYNTLPTPARQRGFHIDSGIELTDLQLLAKLQHFGAATGLLDFTLSPLVALWFACQESNVDGTVFVLDCSPSLNETLSWDHVSEASFSSVLNSLGSPSDLIVWDPPAFGEATPRIIAQQSILVLMHPQVQSSRLVGQIPIQGSDKFDLLEQLRSLGFAEDSLLLDVHGFARANSPSTILREGHESAATLLNTANQQFLRTDYKLAIQNYSTILERYTDADNILILRGNAFAADGKNPEAIEDYDRALSNKDRLTGISVAAVLYNKGNALARDGQHHAAIAAYSEAIGLRQAFQHAYFNRGNSFFALRNLEEAIADYRRTEDWRDPMYNQGNAHMIRGQFQAALACYESALELGEGSEQLDNNLAHARRLSANLQGVDAHWDGEFQAGQTLRTAKIRLPGGSDSNLFNTQLILSGNVGNAGNEGVLNQIGGPGAEGGLGFILRFCS